jgi:hypothetical protein
MFFKIFKESLSTPTKVIIQGLLSICQVLLIQDTLIPSRSNFVRLFVILQVLHTLTLIVSFRGLKFQFSFTKLQDMIKFMNQRFCISFLIHMSIQFYQKIPRIVVPSSNITVSISTFTFHTTMKNLNLQFVSWKILGYKPTHHIFTETL